MVIKKKTLGNMLNSEIAIGTWPTPEQKKEIKKEIKNFQKIEKQYLKSYVTMQKLWNELFKKNGESKLRYILTITRNTKDPKSKYEIQSYPIPFDVVSIFNKSPELAIKQTIELAGNGQNIITNICAGYSFESIPGDSRGEYKEAVCKLVSQRDARGKRVCVHVCEEIPQ